MLRASVSTRTLRNVVGDDTYEVWVSMLRALVPSGRTHRLAPLIAGVLQYGVSRALKSKERNVEGTEAWCLVAATESSDPDEASELINDLLVRLFKDARVKADRETSQGTGYSIIEEAIQEFVRWEYMPWE